MKPIRPTNDRTMKRLAMAHAISEARKHRKVCERCRVAHTLPREALCAACFSNTINDTLV